MASAASEGTSGLQRPVLPLVGLRADFEFSWAEIRDADCGAADPTSGRSTRPPTRSLSPRRRGIHGWEGAISGISETSPLEPIPLGDGDAGR
jgi:hypothetical protein